MAQHDFVINNQGFPAFRSDLNDFLNAVRTFHSGTSRPTGAVAGTIFLDTTNATIPLLKYFDGTDDITLATINHSTNTVTFSGVSTDLVNDLTPQLGGDLDVQTNKVVTTANRNVLVYPNGTGVLEVGGATNSGRIQLNCEQNTHGIKLASPPHSAGQSYTLTFPTTAPTANKVLQTDGSGNLSFASVSGGIEWQAVHTSATLSATANYGYFINTTSNACTVTLPASPVIGNQIALVDYAGTFDTNALTINPNGNKIEGGTSNLQLKGEREGVLLVFTDATQGWLATSGINEGTDALEPIIYSVDVLVVAGGGGSPSSAHVGGGGGAGGFRTATLSLITGNSYTVTVGAGGSGASGSNSLISGSGITTLTSAGGGAGGNSGDGNGLAGGSGGGAAGGGFNDGTGGAGNTPSTSPSQGNSGGNDNRSAPNYGAGGGGGASAVGANGTSTAGGAGGNGTASSITGSSVTYSGGGGGATYEGGTVGSGGSGGGGAGGNYNSTNGVNGTANTGGGAGGSTLDNQIGGSGVVILRILTTNYSSSTTGSPTVTTDGSHTVVQFTGDGTYTA